MSRTQTISNKGFTLVELMLVLLMGGIIMAAIYSAYMSQQKTYINQEQVVHMQQNIRAAVEMMGSELRMAGYDPTTDAGAGFMPGTISRKLVFSADLNGDGSLTAGAANPNENVIYTLSKSDADADGDIDVLDLLGDGRYDNDYNALTREVNGGGAQTVAENIHALEFYYTLEDGSQLINPTNAQLDQIRSVQISILAFAGRPDKDYTNGTTYYPASNPTGDPAKRVWGPYNDNLRRRLLIYNINCRNMGLN